MSIGTIARHVAAAALTVVAIGSLDRWFLRTAASPLPDTVWMEAAPRPLDSWTAEDASGEPVDERLFIGRWSLVFVGYTACPDVCPTTLTALASEREALADVQRVFIAVDEPDDLAAYVAFFDPDLIGLHATAPGRDHLLAQLGATARKRPDGGFDHSTSAFVIDPDARVVAHVLHPTRGGVARAIAAVQRGWQPELRDTLFAPRRPGDLGVVYGSLENTTTTPIVLTGARSPDYADVSLHETVQSGAIAGMRPVASLTIAPGERLELAPGGHHVMLHGRLRPPGPLVLHLDRADGRTLQLGVEDR